MLFGHRDIDDEVAALERRLQDRRDALRRRAAPTTGELAKELVSPSSLLLAFGAGFVLERVTGQESIGPTEPERSLRPILGLLEWVTPLFNAGSLLALLARSIDGGAAAADPGSAAAPSPSPVPAAAVSEPGRTL